MTRHTGTCVVLSSHFLVGECSACMLAHLWDDQTGFKIWESWWSGSHQGSWMETFWVQVLTWKYRLILCLGTMNLVHAATRLHRIFRWWGLIRLATVCARWGQITDDDPSLVYPDLSIYFSSSGIHSSPWYLYCIVFQVCTRPLFGPHWDHHVCQCMHVTFHVYFLSLDTWAVFISPQSYQASIFSTFLSLYTCGH